MNILYIGRFELPDKDATANRVVANAKLLRCLGHNVDLAGWSNAVTIPQKWTKSSYFGFCCYEKYKEQNSLDKMRTFLDATLEIELLKNGNYDMVIAYNFPAVAFKKIFKFCKKSKIKCISDVTEWFSNSNSNPLFRIVKAYDSYLRMRVLNKKTDGLIVISRYLDEYYKDQNRVIIPPLVDKSDDKWKLEKTISDSKIHLVYAGWPSKIKERLDLLVNCIEELDSKYDISLDIYGVKEDEYRNIYQIKPDYSIKNSIVFHGKVSHFDTLKAVKNADYSMVIRESNRKNNAGFPSKLVESISCGTPVLTTNISNVRDYVSNGTNGFIISIESLKDDLIYAIENRNKVKVNCDLFDYHQYCSVLKNFLDF